MPTPVKALENMSKNLTDEERQLREQAEEGVIPDRGRESRMEEPAIMTKNPAARRYWRKVLERMEGLVILDDLDSDALGVYCVMMARYETQCRLLAQAAKELKTARDAPEAVAAAAAGRRRAGAFQRRRLLFQSVGTDPVGFPCSPVLPDPYAEPGAAVGGDRFSLIQPADLEPRPGGHAGRQPAARAAACSFAL